MVTYLPVKNSLSYISQLVRGATHAATAFVVSLVLGSCSGGDAKDVQLIWHLADRRSCMDTSVVQVIVDVEGGSSASTTATGTCHMNAAENQVALKGLRSGVKLHAKAQSAQDAVLYRGELQLVEPVPAVIDLPLYYTGGE